eukprot:6210942-Amphidinium_carterae.1
MPMVNQYNRNANQYILVQSQHFILLRHWQGTRINQMIHGIERAKKAGKAEMAKKIQNPFEVGATSVAIPA